MYNSMLTTDASATVPSLRVHALHPNSSFTSAAGARSRSPRNRDVAVVRLMFSTGPIAVRGSTRVRRPLERDGHLEPCEAKRKQREYKLCRQPSQLLMNVLDRMVLSQHKRRYCLNNRLLVAPAPAAPPASRRRPPAYTQRSLPTSSRSPATQPLHCGFLPSGILR